MLDKGSLLENARKLKYVNDLIKWVCEEKKEDKKRNCSNEIVPKATLQSKGLAILGVKVKSVSPGIGNKRVVEVVSSVINKKIVHGKFKSGGSIRITPHNAYDHMSDTFYQHYPSTTGIITKLTDRALTLALDDPKFQICDMLGVYDIYQNGDSTSYDRMHEVLCLMNNRIISNHCKPQASGLGKWPGSPILIEKFLSRDPLIFSSKPNKIDSGIKLFDTKLNPTQAKAVLHGIEADQLSIIHGPPGTGKSSTLAELIHQLVNTGAKILVCGPSNGSVDNLLDKLSEGDVKCLRFGNPYKIQINRVTKFSLPIQIEASVYGPQLNYLRKKIDKIINNGKMDICYIDGSMENFAEAYEDMEAEAIEYIFSSSQVVFSTLNGVGAKAFQDKCFDVLIIDEATQALEPDCWIAISHCRKLILAGDHHQLPPTVLSKKTGLEVTLFQKLLDFHKKYVSTMLTTQYRMHQDIMEFSSKELYDGRLVAHHSVKFHLLGHLPGVITDITLPPITFLDTSGLGYHESSLENSKKNEGECILVDKHLDFLLKSGLHQKDIAVISPYNGQVSLIKEKLGNKYKCLDIDSVDGFQGREKEAIIISLVRSNKDSIVGFLRDYRRLNVAITRARRHLCIIGDRKTTMSHPITFGKKLPHFKFLYKLGKYLTLKGNTQYVISLNGDKNKILHSTIKTYSNCGASDVKRSALLKNGQKYQALPCQEDIKVSKKLFKESKKRNKLLPCKESKKKHNNQPSVVSKKKKLAARKSNKKRKKPALNMPAKSSSAKSPLSGTKNNCKRSSIKSDKKIQKAPPLTERKDNPKSPLSKATKRKQKVSTFSINKLENKVPPRMVTDNWRSEAPSRSKKKKNEAPPRMVTDNWRSEAPSRSKKKNNEAPHRRATKKRPSEAPSSSSKNKLEDPLQTMAKKRARTSRIVNKSSQECPFTLNGEDLPRNDIGKTRTNQPLDVMANIGDTLKNKVVRAKQVKLEIPLKYSTNEYLNIISNTILDIKSIIAPK